MKNFAQNLFSMVAAFLFLLVSAQAQTDSYGRWIYEDREPAFLTATESETEKAEIMARWQRIGDELKANSSNNEIWGQYQVGDLHISIMRISEKNGYMILHVFTCAMDVHGVEYGDVYFSNDKLLTYPTERFSSRKSHGGKMREMLPQEWVLAKLKDTNYLLREDEIERFFDLFSGLSNRIPNYHELYFEHLVGFAKAARVVSKEYFPQLPGEFKHLIKRPISGKIIEIGQRVVKEKIRDGEVEKDYEGKTDYESVTKVKINVGKVDGVEKDMVFYLISEEADWGMPEIIEIQSVTAKTASGIIRRSLEDKPLKPVLKRKDSTNYESLRIGIPITTSYFVAMNEISEKNKAKEKINEEAVNK